MEECDEMDEPVVVLVTGKRKSCETLVCKHNSVLTMNIYINTYFFENMHTGRKKRFAKAYVDH